MKKIIVCALVLVACDKPRSDPSSSTATPIETTPPPATSTATATATATASAAGGWPAYLPDYPGAKLTNKTKDFESLETKDAPYKVVAFYKDKLAAAGFPPGASVNAGAKDPNQPAVLTVSKGSEMVQITATPVQGTTKISLSIL